jgi:hypothetical protein
MLFIRCRIDADCRTGTWTTSHCFSLGASLDHARTGPLYLARPEIAGLVVQAILEGRDTWGRHW